MFVKEKKEKSYKSQLIFVYNNICVPINFSYFNGDSKSYQVGYYKGKEDVYVDNVKLCGTFPNQSHIKNKAVINFRIPVRN